MLKRVLPVVLIASLALTSVAYACGYGFSGRNGRLYVYIDREHADLVREEVAPPARPIVLTSEQQAAEYFEGFMIETLKREVDWSKQNVMIFAWRGPTDDRLRVQVGVDEQIDRMFQFHPGKREETRMHIAVYRVDRRHNWMLQTVKVGVQQVADAR